MQNYQTEALLSAARDLMDRLADYGYDEIRFFDILLAFESEPECRIACTDDFQRSASWEDQIQVGVKTFVFDGSEFVIPHYFMMREMRELTFMAKRLGNANDLASQMVSAAGREFAAKLKAELSSLRRMIGHEH